MLARENINEVYMYTSTCIGHDDSEVDEPNNVLSWCLLVFGIYVSIYLSTWIVLSGPFLTGECEINKLDTWNNCNYEGCDKGQKAVLYRKEIH